MSTTKSDRRDEIDNALGFLTLDGQSVEVYGTLTSIATLIDLLGPQVNTGKIQQGFAWEMLTPMEPLDMARTVRQFPWREPVHFYNTRGEHGCFTNFSRHVVEMEDKEWPTSEHYFQAMKRRGVDEEAVEAVRKASHPGEAAKMGRDKSTPIREDWDDIRDDVMRYVVYWKFRQHRDCMATLLETGEAKLVERTARDNYWGDGGDGSGENMLGKILMEVREVLRKQIQWKAECRRGERPFDTYEKSLHIPWEAA